LVELLPLLLLDEPLVVPLLLELLTRLLELLLPVRPLELLLLPLGRVLLLESPTRPLLLPVLPVELLPLFTRPLLLFPVRPLDEPLLLVFGRVETPPLLLGAGGLLLLLPLLPL
jgi:hypothetical protein